MSMECDTVKDSYRSGFELLRELVATFCDDRTKLSEVENGMKLYGVDSEANHDKTPFKIKDDDARQRALNIFQMTYFRPHWRGRSWKMPCI